MDENVIKSEIEQGIAQVDDTLTMTEFSCKFEKEKRKLNVFVAAKAPNGETVEINNAWG